MAKRAGICPVKKPETEKAISGNREDNCHLSSPDMALISLSENSDFQNAVNDLPSFSFRSVGTSASTSIIV